MKARELMTKDIWTCRAGDTLAEAARVMWENDCGVVPVPGTDGKVAGVVITALSWALTQGTESTLDFASYNAMGNFGIALTVAGTGLFLVMSLRRYFRYWLVRFIYEMRDQADRVVSRDE